MSKMSTTFRSVSYGPSSRTTLLRTLFTGHSVSTKNTKILTRESNWHKRKVKGAIYIKQKTPAMNRDQGYHLPAIYNQIIPPKSEATHVTPVREQGR